MYHSKYIFSLMCCAAFHALLFSFTFVSFCEVLIYFAICIFHQEANATCQLRGEKVLLLQAKGPALKKHVKLSEEFWRGLIHNHVLSHLEAKAFQVR